MKPAPTKEELLMNAIALYKEIFKSQPTCAGCGPGRVNLIGEHTDYNNGFVFPMALPNVTLIVGAPNGTDEITVFSNYVSNEEKKVTFTIPSVLTLTSGSPHWANYVKGVVCFFNAARVPGFNAVIVSSVPLGAGVSSSAAIEVATFTFLEALTGVEVNKKEKALCCQKAEHVFASVPCGIMDQYISIHGKKGHALLLDCQNLEYEQIPFDDISVCVLITNSNIKHALTGSEYPLRAAQCKEACSIMKVPSLRDASTHDLEKYRLSMPDEVFRRARHVISEISRTSEAAQALRFNDYSSFGCLMLQSHNSLRDDYEVSIPELDELVEIAMKCKGVYGSRLTGAGFGGATVTLVECEHVNDLIEALKESKIGNLEFFIATASDGAQILNNELHAIINANKRSITTQTKPIR